MVGTTTTTTRKRGRDGDGCVASDMKSAPSRSRFLLRSSAFSSLSSLRSPSYLLAACCVLLLPTTTRAFAFVPRVPPPVAPLLLSWRQNSCFSLPSSATALARRATPQAPPTTTATTMAVGNGGNFGCTNKNNISGVVVVAVDSCRRKKKRRPWMLSSSSAIEPVLPSSSQAAAESGHAAAVAFPGGGSVASPPLVLRAAAARRQLGAAVCRGVVGVAWRAAKMFGDGGGASHRRRRRAAGVALVSAAAFVMSRQPAVAAAVRGLAAAGGKGGAGRALVVGMVPSAGGTTAVSAAAEVITLESIAPKLALWFTLFVTSAAFHAAEIAITTLYPWKVKEFAEEEGENSPFQVLNKDITRVLTTILVATTVCTIYNAALFTNLAIQMFGSAGLAYATAALTVTTLFFGELLPKALGVNNAEMVARRILPVIIVLSVVLNPVARSFTFVSKLMLSMFGFKSTETGRVSEEELRLIVTGAKMSGGIESQEGMMIEGVLDLQDTKISEIMRPRVEVVAIEANSTMMDLYNLHQETKYSRIPVYSGEIDRISGVVLSKDLLDFVQEPEKLSSVLVADETESTYFVPETMSVWNVLEEMRRRRLHMAIVVDEYGGTAGVVTLEDILEEVVGEIYDEKEDDDFREEEHYVNVNEDGSFTIHGMADLEDVCTSLDFQEVNEDDLKEFGTLSGYLCSQAGEIPAAGDYVIVGSFMFTITKADERRIEEVHAKLIGPVDSGTSGGGQGSGGGDHQGGYGGQNNQDEGASANADRLPPASSSAGSPTR